LWHAIRRLFVAPIANGNITTMIRFVRCALATFCFAASVGCLALWVGSYYWNISVTQNPVQSAYGLQCFAHYGYMTVGLPSIREIRELNLGPGWNFAAVPQVNDPNRFRFEDGPRGKFVLLVDDAGAWGVFFPAWYAALVFALAGIASLRLGRRFTIRSALVATTVVAGLLGMAVGL
jgi:hypothetical protein